MIIDVRAPVEFAKGSVPNSINLPLLDDDERRQVGVCYKSSGQAAAIALGHELVTGALKTQRIESWQRQLNAHPDAHIMCWRGGQRSAIAQEWLSARGHSLPRVVGGYKAVRTACLTTLEDAAQAPLPWIVLAGQTGVGKTRLLRQLQQALDLEGMANHRGSAFGGYNSPQPALASFENELAYRYCRRAPQPLILEDESRTIGRLAVPESWHVRMQTSPLVLLEAPIATRVAEIAEEYVHQPLHEGASHAKLAERYTQSLQRIAKRLGGVRHQRLLANLQAAFAQQQPHELWIEGLLREYYDPMYDYQLSQKRERIVFRGEFEAVRDYLIESGASN